MPACFAPSWNTAAARDAARKAYDGGERSAEVLRARMQEVMDAEPMARIDYLSVADAQSLVELQRVSGPALALVAVGVSRLGRRQGGPVAATQPPLVS